MIYKRGDRIKVVKGKDYKGMTGTIYYCGKCCKDFRIQFDGIGNNELLKTYKNKIKLTKTP